MLCQSKCNRFAPAALTLLRITVGVIMATHGWQKHDIAATAGMFEHVGLPYPTVSATLAFAGEFLGGLGLIVGLLTPIAAFGIFCTMAVAVFAVHWPNGLLASNNGFEYPLTLLMASLFFISNGAGPYSLDHVFWRRTNTTDL